MSLSTHLADRASSIRRLVYTASPLVLASFGVDESANAAKAALGIADSTRLSLVVPRSSGVPASLAGIAFDYRVRMELGSVNPWATVAFRALDMLHVESTSELTQATLALRINAFEAANIVAERLNDRRARPGTRASYSYVLAYLESVSRGGLRVLDGPVGESLAAAKNGAAFVKNMPKAFIDDSIALLAASSEPIAGWRRSVREGAIYAPNPVFNGSFAVGGADADWIVDGTLVELKTTARPLTPSIIREALLQALGYVLLDWEDQYEITKLSAWFPRYKKQWVWSLKTLLGSDWRGRLTQYRAAMRDVCLSIPTA